MPPHTVYENPAGDYFEEGVAAFLGIIGPRPDPSTAKPIEQINRGLRQCTLLSALAAEAYVNAFDT